MVCAAPPVKLGPQVGAWHRGGVTWGEGQARLTGLDWAQATTRGMAGEGRGHGAGRILGFLGLFICIPKSSYRRTPHFSIGALSFRAPAPKMFPRGVGRAAHWAVGPVAPSAGSSGTNTHLSSE